MGSIPPPPPTIKTHGQKEERCQHEDKCIGAPNGSAVRHSDARRGGAATRSRVTRRSTAKSTCSRRACLRSASHSVGGFGSRRSSATFAAVPRPRPLPRVVGAARICGSSRRPRSSLLGADGRRGLWRVGITRTTPPSPPTGEKCGLSSAWRTRSTPTSSFSKFLPSSFLPDNSSGSYQKSEFKMSFPTRSGIQTKFILDPRVKPEDDKML